MGLRQVFPVQTKRMVRIQGRSCRSVARVWIVPAFANRAGATCLRAELRGCLTSRICGTVAITCVTVGSFKEQTAPAAPGDSEVEFVSYEEVADLFDEYGIEQVKVGEDRVYLRMSDAVGAVHLHLACPETKAPPHNGATVVKVDKQRLPKVVEHSIRRLHLNQV